MLANGTLCAAPRVSRLARLEEEHRDLFVKSCKSWKIISYSFAPDGDQEEGERRLHLLIAEQR